ncbi:hypothetical protein L5515_010706 [Caenorhabditis briggsae]|uniref:Uncharacterized protein n=1 Tax=Caenorhabditis briggsae TaxID=6238 RepID=A0AAE9EVF5_CAEBR|nr:hypothetical protein L5515_010706 [Caenorhabditis briggsae]
MSNGFKITDVMLNILMSMTKEGASDGPQFVAPAKTSRDTLITTAYRLHRTRWRILEPYRRIKNSLKKLQEDYLKSKEANALMRYVKLGQSVREVAMLEKQYWKLLNIPAQDPTEDANCYVVKIIELLEETPTQLPPTRGIGALLQSTIGKPAESNVDTALYDSLKARKSEDLVKECEALYAQLYRLTKKYLGLRRLIKELTDKYDSSRMFPIVPRYAMLKKMIKATLRAPEFAEICHEQTE